MGNSSRAASNRLLMPDKQNQIPELTDEKMQDFILLYIEGVCRELYRRGILTELSFSQLMNRLCRSYEWKE